MQQALYYLSYVILIFFLYKFIRERKIFQLMFVFWSVTVIVSNFTTNNTVLIVIGVIQIILMISILFLLSKARKDAQDAYLRAAAEYEEHGTINGEPVIPEDESEIIDEVSADSDNSSSSDDSDDD